MRQARRTSKPRRTPRRSSATSIWSSTRRSRNARPTSTSSRSRTSSRSATAWTARFRNGAAAGRTSRLPVISRIKVMANLNIAERRLPQDGRIMKTVAGRQVDMRVSHPAHAFMANRSCSACSTAQSVNLDLENLGMPKFIYDYVSETIEKPNGIFIVTGPTGSGKTTTLYAALRKDQHHRLEAAHRRGPGRIRHRRHHPGADQRKHRPDLRARSCAPSSARTRTASWSAKCATSRPAQIAIQASLTGHLVLTTLHTNDAPGAVTRLIDMGVRAVPDLRLARRRARPAADPHHLQGLQGLRTSRPKRSSASSASPRTRSATSTSSPARAATTAATPATEAAKASTSCSTSPIRSAT